MYDKIKLEELKVIIFKTPHVVISFGHPTLSVVLKPVLITSIIKKNNNNQRTPPPPDKP